MHWLDRSHESEHFVIYVFIQLCVSLVLESSEMVESKKNACGQSVLGEIILYFYSISVKSNKFPTLFPYTYKHIHHILQGTQSKTEENGTVLQKQ